MKTTRFILAALACGGLLVAGCEKKTTPPPGSNKPLGGLSENPTSLYGRSAASGRSAARAVEANQAQAVAQAQENSGEAAALKVGVVEFRVPVTWQKGSPGPMQAATYTISTGGGEATCAFFTVGGDTGSNVNRWKGQMKDVTGAPAEAKVRTQSVGGMKVTLVSMTGTYTPASMSGGASAPVPGTGFRGAIIEAPGGSVQVRMTGPEGAVEEAAGAWETMVLGARRP